MTDEQEVWERWENWIQNDVVRFHDLPQELQESKDFIMSAYLSDDQTDTVLRKLIELKDTWLIRDSDVCLKCLKSCGDWEEILSGVIDCILSKGPPSLLQSTEAWMIIAKSSYVRAFRMYAPVSIRANHRIMLELVNKAGQQGWNVASNSLTSCAIFRGKVRRRWRKIASAGFTDLLGDAPSHLLNERTFMLHAIRTEASAFVVCSQRLMRDEEIQETAIQFGGGEHVLSILPQADISYPLVMMYFQYTQDFFDAQRVVPLRMWSDLNLVRKYLETGGIAHDLIPRHFFEDWDCCGNMMASCCVNFDDHDYNPWHFIPHKLQHNRGFLQQMAARGCLFCADLMCHNTAGTRTPLHIYNDFDLQLDLVYFSVKSVDMTWSEEDDFCLPTCLLYSFCQQLEELILDADIFRRIVLMAICVNRPCWRALECPCQLPMLNVGGTAIPKLIAEFIGVPMGIKAVKMSALRVTCRILAERRRQKRRRI